MILANGIHNFPTDGKQNFYRESHISTETFFLNFNKVQDCLIELITLLIIQNFPISIPRQGHKPMILFMYTDDGIKTFFHVPHNVSPIYLKDRPNIFSIPNSRIIWDIIARSLSLGCSLDRIVIHNESLLFSRTSCSIHLFRNTTLLHGREFPFPYHTIRLIERRWFQIRKTGKYVVKSIW